MCAVRESRSGSLSNDSGTDRVGARRWVGLTLAVLLGGLTYLLLPEGATDEALPQALPHAGRVIAGVGVGMAILWVTEALPIPGTALIPIALFPLLTGGEVSIRQTTAPYAHEVIFLFLGGFVLAQAVQRWGLHRRFALRTVLLIGSRPRMLVAGFMAVSAFLSMWISNTATTIMLLPIALSITELIDRRMPQGDGISETSRDVDRFAIALLLGIAYASSIGGMGTLIGTAPNALLAAFLQEEYGIEISFVRWLLVAMPLVAVFVPAAWFILVYVAFPTKHAGSDQRALLRDELVRLGPVSPAERRVLLVFLLTAGLWITRPLLQGIERSDGQYPLAGLTDSGIAIAAAVLLLVIPVREGGRHVALLSWQDAVKLPWGVLILFGGGLSLASAIQKTDRKSVV